MHVVLYINLSSLSVWCQQVVFTRFNRVGILVDINPTNFESDLFQRSQLA